MVFLHSSFVLLTLEGIHAFRRLLTGEEEFRCFGLTADRCIQDTGRVPRMELVSLDQFPVGPFNKSRDQSVDPMKSRVRSKSPTESRGRFNNFGQIYSRKSRKRWSGHVTRICYQSNVCEWAWEKVSRWGWWICPRWANLHFVGDSVTVTPFWWHLEMREFGTMKDLIYFC